QLGRLHPGYDCFVFHRSMVPKFNFGNICIGTGFTSVAFIFNLLAFSHHPCITHDLHLTLHLGLEVMPPLEKKVYRYTRHHFEKDIYPLLKPHLDIKKFPYYELPFHKRLLKWALNPNFHSPIMLELSGKPLKRKIKALVDEIRFSLLEKI
ncbi:MAG: hypothetical protein NZ522_00670, partial [Chitinophagales bacterium]|nr:hypothetical protein [Chitinophagales bacterium]